MRTLFRIVGTLHGIVGLATLTGVIFLLSRGALSSPNARNLYFNPVGTIGGIVVICGLIACMVATWLRPSRAALFAWGAAVFYICTAVLGALIRSGSSPWGNLPHSFYYSAVVRLAGALVITILAKQVTLRSNKSFKPNLLRRSA